MEKWSIQPAPSQSDPLRFRLFIKGSMKDISTLLKRFGALCGRPAPENSPEGYNYSLPLHRVGKPAMQRLRAALEEMSAKSRPVAAAPSSPKVAPPAATPPPAPVAAPAAKVPAPKTAAPKGDLFGATQPLDPEQTFETMIVGPYNRFAHAAATSVVGAPGAMYNPLFLHGLPGVGKTHCLQAIGHAFCASLGPDSVVMSSAYRLSKVVSRALAGGGYDRLKPRLLAAKVLIVDSVHLFTVDERNQPALTEILSHFISDGRQLVMSSLYPPRALGALEEALKISLSRGWAVDLKVPNDGARLEIVQSWLDRRGVGFSADDTRAFLERLGDGYPACELWLRRLEALVSLWKAGGKPLNCDDLLNVLFDPGAEAQPPSSKELAAAKDFSPPPASADAVALALILPKGHEGMAGWLAKSFHEAAAAQGISQSYRRVLVQAYDADQPFGAPFLLGSACQDAGSRAALVVGPPQEAALAAKAGEFEHAVRHVLDSIDVRCGWVGPRDKMSPPAFLRAHLDLLSRRS